MKKPKDLDINKLMLKAHKLGVKNAIDLAARTKTSLVVSENGKIKLVKPNFKYVRVPIKTPNKKRTPKARKKKIAS
jgi:hypothetical protein